MNDEHTAAYWMQKTMDAAHEAYDRLKDTVDFKNAIAEAESIKQRMGIGEKKKITNGDRIRQMTDEELAEFFCQISQCCGNDASCSMCPIYDGCAQNVMCVERWLKQDATDTNVGGKGGDDNVSDV